MIRRHWVLLFLAAILTSSGCGDGTKVKGVVTLDGKPVEGATVSFISEDGKSIFTGLTGSDGSFSLLGPDQKPGISSGTYKVTVVKIPPRTTGALEPGSPDYNKEMAKEQKEGAEKAGPKTGRPPGMPPPGGGGGGVKSQLPQIYANAEKTPLNVKVPPDKQPVAIELKSSP